MFISAFAVEYFSTLLGRNVTVIKIIVDSIIFMVNFVIQREFVFKNK